MATEATWTITMGVYVCPACSFASPVREWHDCNGSQALHPMDSRQRYELAPIDPAASRERDAG